MFKYAFEVTIEVIGIPFAGSARSVIYRKEILRSRIRDFPNVIMKGDTVDFGVFGEGADIEVAARDVRHVIGGEVEDHSVVDLGKTNDTCLCGVAEVAELQFDRLKTRYGFIARI